MRVVRCVAEKYHIDRLVRGVHIHRKVRLLLAAGMIYSRSTARAADHGRGHDRRDVVRWCDVYELFLWCVRDSCLSCREKKWENYSS